jgi:hypothetical protein
MESSFAILVQGGAVGIAIALIFLLWKISERCSDNAKKVLEVVEKNAQCLTQLKDNVAANTEMTKEMSVGIRNMTEMARAAMKITSKKL